MREKELWPKINGFSGFDSFSVLRFQVNKYTRKRHVSFARQLYKRDGDGDDDELHMWNC